jgi:hypothetical protein
MERSDDPTGGDLDAARPAAVEQRRRLDGIAARLLVVVDGGDGGDAVLRRLPRRARRVGERWVGNRADPRLADLQRCVVAVAAVGAAHEVASGAVDRFPVKGDLSPPGAGDESPRRRQPRTPDVGPVATPSGELLPPRSGAAGALAGGHFSPVVATPRIT